MKKAFLFLGLAAAALTLTNCNKQESDLPGADAVQATIKLFTEETKTANDGMNTVWMNEDELSVWFVPSGGSSYSANNKFVITDAENGISQGTIEESLSSGSYDWIAFYPYNSYFVDPENGGDNPGRTYIGGRSDRSQTQTGYNSMAHVAGTAVPLYGIASGVAANETPFIQMKHLSSLAEIVVTNNSGAGITITGLELSAPADVDIVGQYNISFAGSTPTYTKYSTYQSNTAKLTVSDATVLANGSSAKFYLVVKPFQATELTLKVIADAGSVEKTAGLAGPAVFQAGHIKTLNFTYEGGSSQLESITVSDIVSAIKAGKSFEGDLAGAQVTFVSGKYAFMQDSEAGILVYMDGHGLSAGDVISGAVSGSGQLYKNLPEVTSFTYTDKSASAASPTPISLTLAQLLADFDSYMSRYVKLTDVTAKTAFSSRNATITDGSNEITLRDQKNGLTITANSTYDIIGFPTIFNDNKQFGVWLQDNIIEKGGTTPGGGDEEQEGKISVPRTNVSIYVDDEYDISATTNSTATITYESADPSIASVTADGIITGKAEGQTTITVTLPAVPGSFTGDEKEINVTVNPKSGDAGGTWVATSVGNIKDGDEFIFVATLGDKNYAMSNDASGSNGQPKALDVTVSGNKLTKAPDNAVWTFEKSGNYFIFHSSAGETDTWLYCTAANNGLRTGTGDTKLLYIDSNNYLTVEDTKGVARNIGVYSSNSDWRSYEVKDSGVANNIKDQTFTFYVKQ